MGASSDQNGFLGDREEENYIFSLNSKKENIFFVKSNHQFFVSKGAIFISPLTRVVRIDFSQNQEKAILKFLVFGREEFLTIPIATPEIQMFVEDISKEFRGDISPSTLLFKLKLFEKFFMPEVHFAEVKIKKSLGFPSSEIFVKKIDKELFESYRGIEVPIKSYEIAKESESGTISLIEAVSLSAKSIRDFI